MLGKIFGSWMIKFCFFIYMIQSTIYLLPPPIKISKSTVAWYLDASGTFIVRSFYACIQPDTPIEMQAYMIWRSLGPLKIQVTIWVALLDCLPVLRLSLDCIFVPHFPPLCGLQEESIDHLMPFPFSPSVWSTILNKFNINTWPNPIRNMGGSFVLWMHSIENNEEIGYHSPCKKFGMCNKCIFNQNQLGDDSMRQWVEHYFCHRVIILGYQYSSSIFVEK